MSKEFIKGVSVDSRNDKEETTNVQDQDFTKEETKGQILTREEDFIQGLIEATEFANEEKQRVEIVRNGKLFFAFNIRPLGAEEYERCRKKHTKYVRNRQLGMKMPDDTDRVRYQSALIYTATVEEDRAKLWDNKNVWNTLRDREFQVMNGLDVIEFALKAGEKDKIIEAIDALSGYEASSIEEIENVAKN